MVLELQERPGWARTVDLVALVSLRYEVQRAACMRLGGTCAKGAPVEVRSSTGSLERAGEPVLARYKTKKTTALRGGAGPRGAPCKPGSRGASAGPLRGEPLSPTAGLCLTCPGRGRACARGGEARTPLARSSHARGGVPDWSLKTRRPGPLQSQCFLRAQDSPAAAPVLPGLRTAYASGLRLRCPCALGERWVMARPRGR